MSRLSRATRTDPAVDQAILEALVFQGPAVDGVSLRQALTIDSLDLTEHHRMLAAVRNGLAQ